MAFIGKGTKGASYNPGWFLVDDEDCTRITWEFNAEGDYVVTTDDGAKYVPMGSLIFAKVEGEEPIPVGIAYEDVDVTEGNMPGSLVTKGVVYLDRLLLEGAPIPADERDNFKGGLMNLGYGVVEEVPKVTRPSAEDADDADDADGNDNH